MSADAAGKPRRYEHNRTALHEVARGKGDRGDEPDSIPCYTVLYYTILYYDMI